jgi:hypothetical protein
VYAQIAHRNARIDCNVCGRPIIRGDRPIATQVVDRSSGKPYEFPPEDVKRVASITFAIKCRCGGEAIFKCDGLDRTFEPQHNVPDVIDPVFPLEP